MTVWLTTAHDPDIEHSAEVRDGDRVLCPSSDGFDVGVVRRRQTPAVEWLGHIERTMIPIPRAARAEADRPDRRHVDLPEVEALIASAETPRPGAGGLPGTSPPPPT